MEVPLFSKGKGFLRHTIPPFMEYVWRILFRQSENSRDILTLHSRNMSRRMSRNRYGAHSSYISELHEESSHRSSAHPVLTKSFGADSGRKQYSMVIEKVADGKYIWGIAYLKITVSVSGLNIFRLTYLKVTISASRQESPDLFSVTVKMFVGIMSLAVET